MKFNKDFLSEKLYEKPVSEEITGQSRWLTHFRRVFEHDGKFYETEYSVGSTEIQDSRPYEYEPDEIECPEVVATEKTITVYERVS
jgi:hypothetical protein